MFYILGFLLLLAGVFLLILGARLYGQPKVGEQISLWRSTVPLNGEPPQRFYTRLYQALKASLDDKLADGDGTPFEVVLTGMGFGPHRLFAAPSLFAERPLYILVRYKHLRCYIYAGQTPTGLFVSAWGYSNYHVGEGELARLLPIKRAWKYFTKQTLFQFDAAHMFTTSVHEILFETLNGCLQEKGLKPLEEMEKRPILHAFYQNPFYHDRGLFGQSGNEPDRGNEPHRHADLFSDASRSAPAHQVVNGSNDHTNNDHANNAAPVSTAPPPSAAPPQSAAPKAAPPPQQPVPTPPTPPPPPQPLFPVDEWLTEDRIRGLKDSGDSQDGESV